MQLHARNNPHIHRIQKRQREKALPAGYTLSTITLVETFVLPQTTLLDTNVATVAVPVQSTPVTKPAAAATSKSVVAATPLTTPSPIPSVTPSSTAAAIATLSSSSVVTPSSIPSVSPTLKAASSLVTTPSVTPSHASTPVQNSASHSSSPSAVPSANADAVSGASTTSKGLSGGAIGGIIAAILIVVLALAIFFVRKAFLHKRKQKRNTWGAGIYPKSDFDTYEKSAAEPLSLPPPTPEKPQTMTTQPTLDAFLLPPPTSYNNPPPPVLQAPTPTLQPALGAPAVSLSQSPVASHANEYAYVRCTFIPSLPDELSITTGEMVRVLGEFDDGWALCANTHGEQGVVPLECLDRGHSQQMQAQQGGYLGQGTGDWRMSRRASSLYAAQQAQTMLR